MSRGKRGIVIAFESIKFAVRNLDVVFIYLIGVLTSVFLAVGIGAVPWGVGVVTGSELFFVVSALTVVGIYTIGMFFSHGVAVHLIGSRMLNDELGIRAAINDVFNRPRVLAKWAVITAVVTMLSKLSQYKEDNNNAILDVFPAISFISLYRTATFFIHPTLIFYSSDDTKEELSQALAVYAKRIVEVLAMKAALTIFIAGLVVTGVALIVSTVVFVPFIVLSGGETGFSPVQAFLAAPLIAAGAIVFVAVVAWNLNKLIFDIGKTAVYLDSEAPVDDLHGFNQAVMHPDDDTNREAIFKSNVPQAVIETLESWSGSGTFQRRL